MIRVLFRVVVVLVMLQLPLFFATNSRAESQQNQTQVAKSEEETQIEQLKQEIEAIQNQNQKQIEELQKKLDELQAKKSKEEKEGGLSNFAAGYKDGLFLKTRDDKFSLKFNAVIQGQFFIQNFDDNRKMSQDENITFQIRRLRLIFSGNAFYPF